MPVQDPTDREALVRAFASTYSTASEVEVGELIRQYRRVRDFCAEHPNMKSSAVARQLNLPRGRIRAWVENDGRPDAHRGIERADHKGWLNLSWTGSRLHNLGILVAWIFSGGSINQNFVPYFAVEPLTKPVAKAALESLGCNVSEHREGTQSRATEVKPRADGSVLGRLLVTLGAPRGVKNAEQDIALPPWRADAPASLRRAFARTIVYNRGTERGDRPNHPIQIREERPRDYFDELQSFLAAVTDGGVVRSSEKMLLLQPDAASQLYRPPDVARDDHVVNQS